MKKGAVTLIAILFVTLLAITPLFTRAQTVTVTITKTITITKTSNITVTVTKIVHSMITTTITITETMARAITKAVTAITPITVTKIITVTSTLTAPKVVLLHDIVKVGAGSSTYVEFELGAGDIVEINAQIRGPVEQLPSDIKIAIIRPDGGIELQKQKYSGEFTYTFTAKMGGTYKILLDNSYSPLTPKQVDITISKVAMPKPIIVTKPVTKIITVTSTKTVTTTVTSTVTETVANKLQLAMVGIITFIVGFLISFAVKKKS